MKRRAEDEPGFVLHAYPYKETSLIVETFTRRYVRVDTRSCSMAYRTALTLKVTACSMYG